MLLRSILSFVQPWRKAQDSTNIESAGLIVQPVDTTVARDFSELAELNKSFLSPVNTGRKPQTDKSISPQQVAVMVTESHVSSRAQQLSERSRVKVTKTARQADRAVDSVNRGFYITDVPDLPVLSLSSLKRLPKPREIWACHTKTKHVLLAHCPKGTGFEYSSSERSTEERAKFKPWIRPSRGAFDRTHLIPFGYHGSESDPRLLVGWSQTFNRGPMCDYENLVKAKNKTVPIFWHVAIIKQGEKVTWRYTVYNALNGSILLKPQAWEMNQPFHWL